MPDVRRFLRLRSYVFALGLVVVLLVANVIALPAFVSPENWDANLALFAPFALLAMASTPSILSGGGGLDMSVGPLASLVGIVLVLYVLPSSFAHPALSIPICLALGAGVGLVNGLLVGVVRYQPVIATLCVLFILEGINARLAKAPTPAPPNWTSDLAGSFGPVPGALFLLAIPIAVWIALRLLAYNGALLAVGGNDAAAYSAGVNVTAVRVGAYALGGMFAGVAGIALTVLIQSADPGAGIQYTLIALAAVALGGTPIGGGRGGLMGAVLGAATIFLVQNLLATLHVSVFWLQVVYGTLLIVGAVVGSLLTAPPRERVAA